MRRSASEIIRNLESRIARLEKSARKGGPISFSYDGMEINEGKDLLSQLNDLEDGYEFENAYFDGEYLMVSGTFSDVIRVKKKTYLEQMSELLRKNGLVVDTVDDPSLESSFDDADIKVDLYAGWFVTNKRHGAYDSWAKTADVGCYIAFDGKTWTADILWTGFENTGGLYARDEEYSIQRDKAQDYFNSINRRPLSYRATGNVESDLKAIKSMMSRI